ncbi:hypothetical protein TSUD_255920 [Trifolium subterraneum]|uniref:Uncharacterized protein n=1 Tax=Trifolium subterraneum TaxID=3900 RepID=A0A2Z6MP10_TRISU|nr:hypothetical protein TSUD_255920 [Trifolium subterraneum]
MTKVFDDDVEFIFAVTYLAYGFSSLVKEGSDYQKGIYNAGLVQAMAEGDQKLVNIFTQKIQHLEEAAHNKSAKFERKKTKGRMNEKDKEKDVKLQTADVTAPEHSISKKRK